jgi:predicted nucleotidyltransferase
MRAEIVARLREMAAAEGVTVLYACESGSRAWGFPSRNSDYDVRFLYVRPRAWYLSIDVERRRDVIERPITDDLDLSGWDLRKALGLMRKSNPPLMEWLRSPIVYHEDEAQMEGLRALVPAYYSTQAAGYHYLRMAQRNAEAYLGGATVKHKKYLYVLRPLLAVRWIEADAEGADLGPVPTPFADLVARMVEDDALRDAIARLVARKRAGDELDDGPRLPTLHAFIHAELARHEGRRFARPGPKPSTEPLNAYFRRTLDALAG